MIEKYENSLKFRISGDINNGGARLYVDWTTVNRSDETYTSELPVTPVDIWDTVDLNLQANVELEDDDSSSIEIL